MVRKLTMLTAVLLFSQLGWAIPSTAQPREAESGNDLSISLGALALYAPSYEGSGEYEFRGFPLIDIEYRDRFFLDGRNGAGVHLINKGPVTLSASIGYAFGRDEDDASMLRGMGDIDGGALAIVQGGLALGMFNIDVRTSHQFSGTDTGTLIDLGLSTSQRYDSGFFVRPAVSVSYGTDDYMQAYFGVTAAQSVSSGLPSYTASSGFKSVGTSVVVGYALDRRWSLSARIAWDRLLDDAKASPLTREANQFTFGAGVSRRF